MGQIIDITGNRYGKLVVIEFDHMECGYSFWKCRCDCGKVFVARKSAFGYRTSHQYSCGCERNRLSSERFKERNRRLRAERRTRDAQSKENAAAG